MELSCVKAVNALWITDDCLTPPPLPSSSAGDEGADQGFSAGPSSLEFLWFDTAPTSAATPAPSSSSSSSQAVLQLDHPLLTYTMPEFRLVCAQMIPPPTPPPPPAAAAAAPPPAAAAVTVTGRESEEKSQSLEFPAACLQSSLSALVTSSLHTFTTSLLQTHLVPSLQTALSKDFPFAGGSGGSGGSAGKPSLLGSFRCSWESVSLSADSGEGEGEAQEQEQEQEEEGEVLDAPVQPSSAAFHFLSALSQLSHAAFLSMDTTQSLSLLAPDDDHCCLATSSQDVLFAAGLQEYLSQLTTVHEHVERAVTQRAGLEGGDGSLQQLFEDYCVQIVFDLTLCESSLLAAVSLPAKRGGVLSASLQRCRELWEQHIDPINWSLLSAGVSMQVQKYQQRNQLFIPLGLGVGDLVSVTGSAGTGGAEGSATTQSQTQSQNPSNNRFLQLFPASSSSSSVGAGLAQAKKGGTQGSLDAGSSVISK